ncbi:MAG: GDP-L-fucose synthase, partial [Pseudomonadota bacterium]
MRVFVAGHRGMVGSAILRAFESRQAGDPGLELLTRTRSEL